jgi:hypothetical protein
MNLSEYVQSPTARTLREIDPDLLSKLTRILQASGEADLLNAMQMVKIGEMTVGDLQKSSGEYFRVLSRSSLSNAIQETVESAILARMTNANIERSFRDFVNKLRQLPTGTISSERIRWFLDQITGWLVVALVKAKEAELAVARGIPPDVDNLPSVLPSILVLQDLTARLEEETLKSNTYHTPTPALLKESRMLPRKNLQSIAEFEDAVPFNPFTPPTLTFKAPPVRSIITTPTVIQPMQPRQQRQILFTPIPPPPPSPIMIIAAPSSAPSPSPILHTPISIPHTPSPKIIQAEIELREARRQLQVLMDNEERRKLQEIADNEKKVREDAERVRSEEEARKEEARLKSELEEERKKLEAEREKLRTELEAKNREEAETQRLQAQIEKKRLDEARETERLQNEARKMREDLESLRIEREARQRQEEFQRRIQEEVDRRASEEERKRNQFDLDSRRILNEFLQQIQISTERERLQREENERYKERARQRKIEDSERRRLQKEEYAKRLEDERIFNQRQVQVKTLEDQIERNNRAIEQHRISQEEDARRLEEETRNRLREEDEKKQLQAEMERKRVEIEEANRQEAEAAQQRAEEEQRRRLEQIQRIAEQKEASKKRQADVLRKKKELEAAQQKIAEEEAKKRALELEEQARIQRELEEAELARKKEEQEQARKRAEEIRQKAAEGAALKKQQEEELLRARQQAEIQRKREEEERRIKLQEEQELERKRTEAEAQRKRKEEEDRRKKQREEEEAKKKREDEEAQRKQALEEAQRKRDEEQARIVRLQEEERLKKIENDRIQREADLKRQREEEDEKREREQKIREAQIRAKRAEEDLQRIKNEEEAAVTAAAATALQAAAELKQRQDEIDRQNRLRAEEEQERVAASEAAALLLLQQQKAEVEARIQKMAEDEAQRKRDEAEAEAILKKQQQEEEDQRLREEEEEESLVSEANAKRIQETTNKRAEAFRIKEAEKLAIQQQAAAAAAAAVAEEESPVFYVPIRVPASKYSAAASVPPPNPDYPGFLKVIFGSKPNEDQIPQIYNFPPRLATKDQALACLEAQKKKSAAANTLDSLFAQISDEFQERSKATMEQILLDRDTRRKFSAASTSPMYKWDDEKIRTSGLNEVLALFVQRIQQVKVAMVDNIREFLEFIQELRPYQLSEIHEIWLGSSMARMWEANKIDFQRAFQSLKPTSQEPFGLGNVIAGNLRLARLTFTHYTMNETEFDAFYQDEKIVRNLTWIEAFMNGVKDSNIFAVPNNFQIIDSTLLPLEIIDVQDLRKTLARYAVFRIEDLYDENESREGLLHVWCNCQLVYEKRKGDLEESGFYFPNEPQDILDAETERLNPTIPRSVDQLRSNLEAATLPVSQILTIQKLEEQRVRNPKLFEPLLQFTSLPKMDINVNLNDVLDSKLLGLKEVENVDFDRHDFLNRLFFLSDPSPLFEKNQGDDRGIQEYVKTAVIALLLLRICFYDDKSQDGTKNDIPQLTQVAIANRLVYVTAKASTLRESGIWNFYSFNLSGPPPPQKYSVQFTDLSSVIVFCYLTHFSKINRLPINFFVLNDTHIGGSDLLLLSRQILESKSENVDPGFRKKSVDLTIRTAEYNFDMLAIPQSFELGIDSPDSSDQSELVFLNLDEIRELMSQYLFFWSYRFRTPPDSRIQLASNWYRYLLDRQVHGLTLPSVVVKLLEGPETSVHEFAVLPFRSSAKPIPPELLENSRALERERNPLWAHTLRTENSQEVSNFLKTSSSVQSSAAIAKLRTETEKSFRGDWENSMFKTIANDFQSQTLNQVLFFASTSLRTNPPITLPLVLELFEAKFDAIPKEGILTSMGECLQIALGYVLYDFYKMKLFQPSPTLIRFATKFSLLVLTFVSLAEADRDVGMSYLYGSAKPPNNGTLDDYYTFKNGSKYSPIPDFHSWIQRIAADKNRRDQDWKILRLLDQTSVWANFRSDRILNLDHLRIYLSKLLTLEMDLAHVQKNQDLIDAYAYLWRAFHLVYIPRLGEAVVFQLFPRRSPSSLTPDEIRSISISNSFLDLQTQNPLTGPGMQNILNISPTLGESFEVRASVENLRARDFRAFQIDESQQEKKIARGLWTDYAAKFSQIYSPSSSSSVRVALPFAIKDSLGQGKFMGNENVRYLVFDLVVLRLAYNKSIPTEQTDVPETIQFTLAGAISPRIDPQLLQQRFWIQVDSDDQGFALSSSSSSSSSSSMTAAASKIPDIAKSAGPFLMELSFLDASPIICLVLMTKWSQAKQFPVSKSSIDDFYKSDLVKTVKLPYDATYATLLDRYWSFLSRVSQTKLLTDENTFVDSSSRFTISVWELREFLAKFMVVIFYTSRNLSFYNPSRVAAILGKGVDTFFFEIWWKFGLDRALTRASIQQQRK